MKLLSPILTRLDTRSRYAIEQAIKNKTLKIHHSPEGRRLVAVKDVQRLIDARENQYMAPLLLLRKAVETAP